MEYIAGVRIFIRRTEGAVVALLDQSEVRRFVLVSNQGESELSRWFRIFTFSDDPELQGYVSGTLATLEFLLTQPQVQVRDDPVVREGGQDYRWAARLPFSGPSPSKDLAWRTDLRDMASAFGVPFEVLAALGVPSAAP